MASVYQSYNYNIEREKELSLNTIIILEAY